VSEREESFPLFPLELVLLPEEIVPLHIFEDRYKLMIGSCLEQDSEFGIIWLSDDGLREVGCSARVTQVLDRDDDGRMNILARGERPFRLDRRIEDLPYPAGDVEFLDDDFEDADSGLLDSAHRRYADLDEHVTDERPADEQLSELGAYGMAATIELSPAPKQALLEERSEATRLKVVTELFDLARQRLEEAERTNELARSNGKVRL